MRSMLRSAPGRLAAYTVVLLVALAGGAVVGAAVGPEPTVTADHDEAGAGSGGEHAGSGGAEGTDGAAGDHGGSSAPTSDAPAGLSLTEDGYRLDLRTPAVEPGRPVELALAILGPDGIPVTDFDVEHDVELHLVVVSRDLARYAHVHPTRDEVGGWTVTVPPLEPGSYRVYADAVPTGSDGITLAADLAVAGPFDPAPTAGPSASTTVDGYDVEVRGALVAGEESVLTVSVSRGGEAVGDLQPYLGALGHLVAIRGGDLAYLHVHPLDETDDAGGPDVRFAVEVPSAGTYGLYFDFAHGGAVRTATFVAEVQP